MLASETEADSATAAKASLVVSLFMFQSSIGSCGPGPADQPGSPPMAAESLLAAIWSVLRWVVMASSVKRPAAGQRQRSELRVAIAEDRHSEAGDLRVALPEGGEEALAANLVIDGTLLAGEGQDDATRCAEF